MENGSVIEFPCKFPIKAMGLAIHNLDQVVYSIVRKHVPEINKDSLSKRPSSNGKYISVTVTVDAYNRRQLDAIYHDLTAHEHIIMAL